MAANNKVITDEAYKLLLDALKKANEGWRAGIAWGSIHHVDGTLSFMADTSACHAWVNRGFQKFTAQGQTFDHTPKFTKTCKNFVVVNCYKREMRHCSDEAAHEFVLWLAKESPFKNYIINADDEESLKNEGVVLFCGPDGLTHSEALWVCKSMRYAIESAKALDAWLVMYRKGAHPMLALAACQHFRTHNTTPHGKVYVYTETIFIHNAVFTSVTDKLLPTMLKSESFRFPKRTSGLFLGGDVPPGEKTYGEIVQPADSLAKFLGKTSSFTYDDGWGGKIVVNGCKEDTMVERVLEFQRQFSASKPIVDPVVTSETVYLDGDL